MKRHKGKFILKIKAIWAILTQNEFITVSTRHRNINEFDFRIQATYHLHEHEVDAIAAELYPAASDSHRHHYQAALVNEAKEILKCS